MMIYVSLVMVISLMENNEDNYKRMNKDLKRFDLDEY
jgi:hypothetical protein